MEQRFSEKVAVVTGGASGIGLAIVRRFVTQGGSVVVADINRERLNAVQEEFGERVRTIHTDVTRERDVEAMVALAVGEYGGLDCGFNVAGSARPAPLHELPEEDWDFTVNLCLKGVFLSMKYEARQMLAQGRGGAIVNISSLNSEVPAFGLAAYCASKAGASMLAKCGTLEWAHSKIRVNAVSPGLTTGTNFGSDSRVSTPDIDNQEDLWLKVYLERIPMDRPATVDEQAAAACFLASDDAVYISGVNLFVDGGWNTTTYPNLRKLREQLAL